jgi:hypothetical protein
MTKQSYGGGVVLPNTGARRTETVLSRPAGTVNLVNLLPA